MDELIKKQVDGLLESRDQTPVCIALDWLSLYFNQTGIFKPEYNEADRIEISQDCYLLAIDRPTLHFNTHFVLMYKKEECAHLLCNSKNERFYKPEVVKVDFSNHTLYSGDWIKIYNELLNYGLTYRGASRIDIAIDNVGYLQEMMNIYAKQTIANRTIKLKNSSTSRAKFSAKVLNTDTMMFENFHIGSMGGNKMITIYNKSLELVRSGKTWIQEYWLRNGIIDKMQDLEQIGNEVKRMEKRGYDVYHLEGFTNIYRFELRLKSESIKEIKDFSIEMLTTGKGMADIVKTHCQKYFDGCFDDSRNTTKCTSFDLLPYDRLNAQMIAKVSRPESTDVYKAKISIHGIIKDIYKGYVKPENYNESVEIILDRVFRYRLPDYTLHKMEEWHNRYSGFIDKERIDDVTIVINQVISRISEYLSDTDELALMNNQAGATAKFGDG